MQNDATVIRASLATHENWQFGVVLADLEDSNHLHPYVVWDVERHELNADPWVALHGDYHRDLKSAEAAFAKRVGLRTE
jgi:hypothetical protein